MGTHILNFVAAERGGGLTYVENFCRELAHLDTSERFVTVICGAGWKEPHDRPKAPNVEYRITDMPKRSFVHRLYFDNRVIKAIAREVQANTLYSQNYAVWRFPGRQVLNLQNALRFSRTYSKRVLTAMPLCDRVEVRLRWLWTRASIREADIIVAPTQAMLRQVREQVNLRAKRWVALHHGFDRERFSSGPALNARQQETLDNVGSDTFRILFVSGFYWHKNVDTLIEGFGKYRSRGGRGKLILTFARERLTAIDGVQANEAFKRCDYKNEVVFIGPVPGAEIHDLYRQCDAFAFPSCIESFGFPMVEAMSSGLPVLASDTPVNREICGCAAMYFATYSSDALANALYALAGNKRLRDELAAKGKQRSRQFSWANHVRQVVALLAGEEGQL